jgi:hypothetical protein
LNVPTDALNAEVERSDHLERRQQHQQRDDGGERVGQPRQNRGKHNGPRGDPSQ